MVLLVSLCLSSHKFNFPWFAEAAAPFSGSVYVACCWAAFYSILITHILGLVSMWDAFNPDEFPLGMLGTWRWSQETV